MESTDTNQLLNSYNADNPQKLVQNRLHTRQESREKEHQCSSPGQYEEDCINTDINIYKYN